MEEESIKTKEFFDKLYDSIKPKVRFPNDKKALNSWEVYETSYQTKLFLSENNRTIYADAFDFKEPINAVESLKTLAIKAVLANYTGGPLDSSVQLSDKNWFGEHLDIELPVEDLTLLIVCNIELTNIL